MGEESNYSAKMDVQISKWLLLVHRTMIMIHIMCLRGSDYHQARKTLHRKKLLECNAKGYALPKEVQLKRTTEEFALSMGQRRDYALLKDAQATPTMVECA